MLLLPLKCSCGSWDIQNFVVFLLFSNVLRVKISWEWNIYDVMKSLTSIPNYDIRITEKPPWTKGSIWPGEWSIKKENLQNYLTTWKGTSR